MLPTPQGGGFSGYARPIGPRSRVKGLPSPNFLPTSSQDIQRRVRVAVQHQPAARADVGPHAERLLHPLGAGGTVGQDARTGLGGERRGTATTRRPAYAALPSRMVRNAAHPASEIAFARWGFRTRLRTCKSSR